MTHSVSHTGSPTQFGILLQCRKFPSPFGSMEDTIAWALRSLSPVAMMTREPCECSSLIAYAVMSLIGLASCMGGMEPFC